MSYETAVQQSYERPVLVLFSAPWCGPCKSLKPVLERLQGEVGFAYEEVDGAEHRELVRALAIRNVPTMVILRDGTHVASAQGAKPEGVLREWLAAYGLQARTTPAVEADSVYG